MLDQVGDLIREVAASVVLPRFQHLADDEILQKSPGDLVTVADQEAEKALTSGLTALLPGSVVVGEEGVAADPRVLDRLQDRGSVWIVDPIDGTNNFAAGTEPFAIMVALVRAGEIAASWILDVPGDHLTVAEAGSGAFRDGVRVKTRTDTPGVGDLSGAVAQRYLPPHLRKIAVANAPKFREVTPGRHCAGWEYPAVALDRQQFTLFWRILPWDHAPGALIVREAGGTVRHLDGSPYRPTGTAYGMVVAPNEDIWHTVRDAIFPDLSVL